MPTILKTITSKLTITALTTLIILTAHLELVDTIGKTYTESGFKRALLTFGAARGLNGVISVAQGTEVAIQPAGIGINFTPGQILDPVNDLVERFSWIMLASSTSLGIQRVLLNITSSKIFTLIIAFFSTLALVVFWRPALARKTVRRGLYKTAMVVVVLRFAIPAVAIASEMFYTFFLEDQYNESTIKLEQTTAAISSINEKTEQGLTQEHALSFLDKAKRLYEKAAENIDFKARIEEYKTAAADISEYVVNLIVVFVLQTIICPLLFLWGIVHLLKHISTSKS